MKDLTVAAWQTKPARGDVEGNLDRLARAAASAAAQEAQLLVAPEMALTGWHPDLKERATEPDGPLAARVGEAARDHKVGIATSLLTHRDGRYYNTFTLWGPDGRVAGRQDKIHLWAAEADALAAGTTSRPIPTPWGAMGGLVCYDVEFPEVARTLALGGAEVLLVPSAFYSPVGWDLATRTRALENGCWLVAANQWGGQPENPHNGTSRVVDPFGQVAAALPATGDGLVVVRLTAQRVAAARAYAPFLRDRRLGVPPP